MLSKTKSEGHKPYEAPLRDSGLTGKHRSVLHEDLTFTGNLNCDGLVDLAGTIIGDLTADTLVLSKTGRIQGNLRARTVTIEGAFEGTIAALKVVVKSVAQVKADISAMTFVVEPGAALEGSLCIKPSA